MSADADRPIFLGCGVIGENEKRQAVWKKNMTELFKSSFSVIVVQVEYEAWSQHPRFPQQEHLQRFGEDEWWFTGCVFEDTDRLRKMRRKFHCGILVICIFKNNQVGLVILFYKSWISYGENTEKDPGDSYSR